MHGFDFCISIVPIIRDFSSGDLDVWYVDHIGKPRSHHITASSSFQLCSYSNSRAGRSKKFFSTQKRLPVNT